MSMSPVLHVNFFDFNMLLSNCGNAIVLETVDLVLLTTRSRRKWQGARVWVSHTEALTVELWVNTELLCYTVTDCECVVIIDLKILPVACYAGFPCVHITSTLRGARSGWIYSWWAGKESRNIGVLSRNICEQENPSPFCFHSLPLQHINHFLFRNSRLFSLLDVHVCTETKWSARKIRKLCITVLQTL